MRATIALIWVGLSAAQDPAAAPAFDVASVKPSARIAGPDANNLLTFEPAAFRARNATLRRLVAEAYSLQLPQVLGPAWLDRNEYDIEAKTARPASKEELALMLRALLNDRFALAQHHETRRMQVHELAVDKNGPKVRPIGEGTNPPPVSGPHFRGDMRRFADLLAIQLTIRTPDDPTQPGRAGGTPVPVLDKTGLTGTYDIPLDVRPDGSDIFTLWQRALVEKMGLKLDGRRTDVDVLVIDDARKVPTGN